jgi:hypothetical protein
MDALPAILKFGLTGLAAIIVFLAYQLLLSQSKKERPNKLILETLKAFMVLGVILAVISAISSTTELMTNLKHQESLNDLRSQLTAAQGEITRLREATGNQETVAQLEQKLAAAEAEVERLKQTSAGQQEVARLESELAVARKSLQDVAQITTTQRTALNRYITDRIEKVLFETSGKWRSVSKSEQIMVRRVLLRRAVFLNMLAFEADGDILRSALEHLVNRGHSDLKPAIEEVVIDLPNLKVSKLRWLEDEAIPALAEDIQKLRMSPVQRGPIATVPLPQEFVVVNVSEFGQPVAHVTDMASLQEEVALLKKSL